jgi:hypothetical protein
MDWLEHLRLSLEHLSCLTEFGVSTTFRDFKITAITAVGTLENVPVP